MKIITLLSLLALNMVMASEVDLAKGRCAQERAGDEVLYSSDFSWGMSLEDIKRANDEVYYSGKRLKNRAFFDGEKFILMAGKQQVVVPENFILSIVKHVESALKRNYVDFIIFPDMGHSHFFIPQKFYDEELATLPTGDKANLYNKMFSHPELKILYHTAEQLKMMDDEKKLLKDKHLQWRYYTRNIVGDNKAQGHLEIVRDIESNFNTAHDYEEGFRYWGAGFNISANQEGCFPFVHNGKTFYFDLSLDDLGPDPSAPTVWE